MAQFDLVIRGGTVVDGTGVPRYQADLAIRNGRVARVSGRIQGGGAREIDARGCGLDDPVRQRAGDGRHHERRG